MAKNRPEDEKPDRLRLLNNTAQFTTTRGWVQSAFAGLAFCYLCLPQLSRYLAKPRGRTGVPRVRALLGRPVSNNCESMETIGCGTRTIDEAVDTRCTV